MQFFCVINILELFWAFQRSWLKQKEDVIFFFFLDILSNFLVLWPFSFSLKIADGCGPKCATQILFEHNSSRHNSDTVFCF